MLICVVLLLDFTASNPTGRRYSSETIDLSLSSAEKGRQGEDILSLDLDLPPNDTVGRVCICTNPTSPPDPIACNSCLAYVESLQQNRRPDFITSKYIIEVKNRQELLYSGDGDRDTAEITDYAIAARALHRSLWVFVRTDTDVDSQFHDLVETTGGKIVGYLAVPGHVDKVAQAAKVGLLASVIVLVFAGACELRTRRGHHPAPGHLLPRCPSMIWVIS
jgi:hypothetical protein